MFGWICPLHRGNKSKRTYNKSRKSKRARGQSFTHLTRQDRETITDLHQQGHTIRAIADLSGRSTRTVHKVLHETGIDLQEDSTTQAVDTARDVEPRIHPGLSRAGARARLFALLEPGLVEHADEVFDRHPEIAEAAVFKALDLEPPHKPTFDDKIEELITQSPEHLRRVVDHRVAELLRGGQSEYDVVARWLELILTVAERLQNATWGQAARDLVKSGELSKTVSAITTAFRSPIAATPSPSTPPAQSPQAVPAGSTQAAPTQARPPTGDPPLLHPKAPGPKAPPSRPNAAGQAEKARMREVIAAPLKTVGASEASDVLEVKSRGTNGPVSAT